MTPEDIIFFGSWFEDYAHRFCSDDAEVEANLRYKKEHSYRVRDYILTIGQDLQLDMTQMLLAEVIGLFHDVGRFEQYTKYRTFKDYLSEDHAELGLAVLNSHKILNDRCDSLEKEIIYAAIKNHNRRIIQEHISGKTLMFCKLIRDADKLDIFDQIISFYENPELTPYLAVESNHENKSYTQEIIQGILNGEQISYSSVKTPVDIKLTRLAWLLDLSYRKSLEIAQRKRYLARLKVFIPDTPDTLKVFRYVAEQMTGLSKKEV